MSTGKAVRGSRYNADHFAAIEKILGYRYQLTDDQKARIALAATNLNVDEKIFKPTPGAPAQLKKIQDLSDKLHTMIVRNDPALLGSELHEEAIEVLSKITIRQSPPTLGRGRIPEEARRNYILNLSDIYRDITGKRARMPRKYTSKKLNNDSTQFVGKFHDFVFACLSPVFPEMRLGLGKAIQEVLSGRK